MLHSPYLVLRGTQNGRIPTWAREDGEAAHVLARSNASELNDPNGIPNELDEPTNIGGTDGRSCAEFGPATPEISGNEDLARSSAL